MYFLLAEGTTQTVETVFCVLVASWNIFVVSRRRIDISYSDGVPPLAVD